MKTLIVYYSYTGNNEKLALELQKKLDCSLLKIEELKRRTWFTIALDLVFNRTPAIKTTPCRLAEYDHVICVAPIWGSKIASPLKTFLNSEKDKIKSYSFLSLCQGTEKQKKKVERQITGIMTRKPVAIAELWISTLKKGTDAMKYSVTPADFETFEPQIYHFLRSEGMPFAPGWQVMQEYGD